LHKVSIELVRSSRNCIITIYWR